MGEARARQGPVTDFRASLRLLSADAVHHSNAGSQFNELSQNFRRAVTLV
jgi:hypothetical protein